MRVASVLSRTEALPEVVVKREVDQCPLAFGFGTLSGPESGSVQSSDERNHCLSQEWSCYVYCLHGVIVSRWVRETELFWCVGFEALGPRSTTPDFGTCIP